MADIADIRGLARRWRASADVTSARATRVGAIGVHRWRSPAGERFRQEADERGRALRALSLLQDDVAVSLERLADVLESSRHG